MVVTKPVSPVSLFSEHRLPTGCHVHIWQVSRQILVKYESDLKDLTSGFAESVYIPVRQKKNNKRCFVTPTQGLAGIQNWIE